MPRFNTWIEINPEALRSNYTLFRNLIGGTVKLCAVVKANAYGHGIVLTAKLLHDMGIDFFAVHSLEEALILKQSGYNLPILIMGYVLLDHLESVVDNQFRIVTYNKETVREVGKIAQSKSLTAFLHFKLETGTNRQGIHPGEIKSFFELAQQYNNLQIEGVYTHFANIEDTTNHKYAGNQLAVFKDCTSKLEENCGKIPIKHTACSAAALLFPSSYFDMVRVGISLYGMWPSRETFLSYKMEHDCDEDEEIIKPVLSWKTRISQVKEIAKGSFIGYGCTYRTTTDSKIAVLPIGYSDGYDRKLSNNGHVLIGGQRAPIRGRICMNITLVDVTHIPDVKVEDEVVLIGKQGKEEISADHLAGLVGTINYEILSRINPNIPRIISS